MTKHINIDTRLIDIITESPDDNIVDDLKDFFSSLLMEIIEKSGFQMLVQIQDTEYLNGGYVSKMELKERLTDLFKGDKDA